MSMYFARPHLQPVLASSSCLTRARSYIVLSRLETLPRVPPAVVHRPSCPSYPGPAPHTLRRAGPRRPRQQVCGPTSYSRRGRPTIWVRVRALGRVRKGHGGRQTGSRLRGRLATPTTWDGGATRRCSTSAGVREGEGEDGCTPALLLFGPEPEVVVEGECAVAEGGVLLPREGRRPSSSSAPSRRCLRYRGEVDATGAWTSRREEWCADANAYENAAGGEYEEWVREYGYVRARGAGDLRGVGGTRVGEGIDSYRLRSPMTSPSHGSVGGGRSFAIPIPSVSVSFSHFPPSPAYGQRSADLLPSLLFRFRFTGCGARVSEGRTGALCPPFIPHRLFSTTMQMESPVSGPRGLAECKGGAGY
ncbi:hypothetical protein DFH09DRAFT_1337031 [Mycena vulgaris]|nr:hypothetical protein DFH09DRAFT_1337031 [Mycena vulgaris]